jgi:hypothetical protein
MPRKTDGEKIDELEKLGERLTERIDTTRKELEAVYDAHSETARAVADMRREYDRQITLLTREVEELRSWKADTKKHSEEWSRRLWAFGPNLLAAVVGGLIAAAVAYLVPRS